MPAASDQNYLGSKYSDCTANGVNELMFRSVKETTLCNLHPWPHVGFLKKDFWFSLRKPLKRTQDFTFTILLIPWCTSNSSVTRLRAGRTRICYSIPVRSKNNYLFQICCVSPITVATPLLLGLRVGIPPGAWMSVSECCVLSGRGLCVGLIARPEESYLMCDVSECDHVASIDNEEALAH